MWYESHSHKVKQIHDMDVFIPLYISNLTKEEKDKALRGLMFHKERRCK